MKLIQKFTSSLLIFAFIFTSSINQTMADWFDTDWDYRVKLTTNTALIPGDSTEIELLIDLSVLPSDFFNNVNSNGSDIRVTDSDETTILNHDLVSIDTTNQTGELHVKVPNLSSTTQRDIYIYYGNSLASNSSSANTWSNYRAVWHLDEPTATSTPTKLAVASMLAMDGADGGFVNLFGESPLTEQINVVIDEDQINDQERAHTTENINYFAFNTENQSSILDTNRTTIGEMGKIEDLSITPTTQNLLNTYTDPIIVLTPTLVDINQRPAVTRISDISSNSFTSYIQNPGDVNTPTSRDVFFLVIESGSHTLPGGIQLEADKTSITGVNENGNWSNTEMFEVSPINSYSTPIVLGQVLTNNDPNWQTFWTSNGSQQGPPTTNDIYIGRHVGEDTNLTRNPEDIGWIILEEGTGFTNNIEWIAERTSDTVRGVDNSPPFSFPVFSNLLQGAFKDSTINGFNADFNGGVNGEEVGQIGRSVFFDGATNTNLPIGGLNYNTADSLNELTASFWLRTTQNSRSGILDFDRSEHWQVGLNFHNASGENGRISFDTANNQDGIQDLNSSDLVNDDSWNYVVAVFDESDTNDKKIYINGELSIQASQHTTGLGKNTERFGFMGDGSEASSFNGNVNNIPYTGFLDEVRIQHSANSADQILTTFNNQSQNSTFWTVANQEPRNQAPTSPTSLFSNTNNAQTGDTNPINLSIGGSENRTINFSAIFNDPDLGDEATQAQIQVSTDSTFNTITHWDSGLNSITPTTEGNRIPDIEYGNFGSAPTLGLSMDDGNIIYYWRIRLADTNGETSEYSSNSLFTVLDIPNDPTGVSATKIEGNPDTFSINWQNNSNVEERYEIQVQEDTGGGFGSYSDITNSPVLTDVTSVIDNNTLNNAAYNYRVRACNYAGCSQYTNETTPVFTDPLSPINVNAFYQNDSEFDVNFTDRSVINKVDLERCDGSLNCTNNSYTIIESGIDTVINIPEVVNDTNPGLQTNQTYRWRARVNNGGVSEYTNSAFEYTTPSSPSDIQAEYIIDSAIMISWTDNSNHEEGFRIYVSENGGPYTELTPGINSTSSNQESYIFNASNSDSSYQFNIVAYIAPTDNNLELFSSDVFSQTTFTSPLAPSDLIASYNSDSDIDINWTDNSQFEEGFNILASENNGPFTQIGSVLQDEETFKFTTANPDSSYLFKVQSFINANPPTNPTTLISESNETEQEIYTTPTSPEISILNISSTSIDFQITDNSQIEQGFIIFDSDLTTEIIRLNVEDLNNWTETGLSPNTLYGRAVATFIDVPTQDELISTPSTIVSTFTKANAPENISFVDNNNDTTTINWTDGNNPIGTEFIAIDQTNNTDSGWSTSLNWTIPTLKCDTNSSILVKSRNQDLIESFAEVFIIEAEECRRSGSSSSSSGSNNSFTTFITNNNTEQEAKTKASKLSCQYKPRTKYEFKNSSQFKAINNKTIFENNQSSLIFSDFKESQWGREYTDVGLRYKIVQGYDNKTFQPNEEITAGEMSKILVQAAQLELLKTPNSNKLNEQKNWSTDYIYTLIENGIKDYPTNPNLKIQRIDAIKFVSEIYKLNSTSSDLPFIDIQDLSNNNLQHVQALYERRILEGYNDQGNRVLKPNQNISRQEALKISLLTHNRCFD